MAHIIWVIYTSSKMTASSESLLSISRAMWKGCPLLNQLKNILICTLYGLVLTYLNYCRLPF